MHKRTDKHLFTQKDLDNIFLALWTSDDLVFIPERARLHQWPSLRDVELWLLRHPDGNKELICSISQRWVKSNRDPETIV